MSSSPSAEVASTYDRKVACPQPDPTSSLPIQTAGPRLFQPSSVDYLAPFKGCDHDWTWVVHQIRDLPLDFARRAETLFIHQALYGDDGTLPPPLRAAFGICAAASVSLNEHTRPVFFRALDDEVAELLRAAPSSSTSTTVTTPLAEDLARLQAAVLYQIIRLFQGGAEQRVVAERQEFLVRSYGLALLQRADAELHHDEPHNDELQSWQAWLLEESVRRTVFVAFKLYTIYSHFRHGVCAETEALAMLPVSSSRPPGSWWSREAFYRLPHKDGGLRRRMSPTDIVTYGEFTQQWEVAPRGDIDAYEMIMLVGCKGLGRVEALIERSRRDAVVV
ncbi:uncharacterized protein E0L32_001275 [Thyridium curvatum]|uniref:Transcription factor domain-containing protein n=1 Tax=Thyridium curvatum TaxID=1093900 RepID=A0A507AZ45_9PEZI|nr:uncharacterized protein E0L32_001275 [Thyridium curvatum]TPX10078.1 hypothetical protein E0L32_001275 [Thyridium curvatum]